MFELIPDPDCYKEEYGEFAVGLQIEAESERFEPLQTMTMAEVNCVERLNELRMMQDFKFGLICAYGATRTFSASRYGDEPELARDENEWVISLFQWDARITNPYLLSKLMRGDLRNIRNAPESLDSELQTSITSSLKCLLPTLELEQSSRNVDVYLNGVSLEFSELSDGYRSLLTILGHLVRSQLKLVNWESDATKIHGIVIIDEVDLHLHPSWQQRILKDLQNAFPNVQFILSTHSPLIASAASDTKVYQLENGTVALKEVFGWLAEDIYREMGLNSSRVTKIQEQLSRYGELDQKRLTGTITDEEIAEMEDIDIELRSLPRGDPAVLLLQLNNMSEFIKAEE